MSDTTYRFIGKVVGLSEGDGGRRRAKVQLLRTGEWAHPRKKGQKLKITPTTLATFERNFNDGVRGHELPSNFDHDDPLCKRSPSWLVGMSREGDKLYGTMEFTDKTLEEDVEAGRVKYVSPELLFGWQNPADGKTYDVMKAVAWTNVPYIKGQEPASFVNFSEAATDDPELSEAGSSRTAFLKVLEEVHKEVQANGWDGTFDSWKWDKDRLVNAYDAMQRASKEGMAKACHAFEKSVAEYFSDLAARAEESRIACTRFLQSLFAFSSERLAQSYLDGPFSVDAPHRPPEGLALAEVDTGGTGNRAFDDSADDPDDDDDDRDDPDDADRLPSDAQDPDAEDPTLPSQCRNCKKLFEGSCPFAGIDTKTAAAGEGNCPQYVSNETQITPERDAEKAGQQSGASRAHFSESHMPTEPNETVSLTDFEGVKEQVDKLSETLAGVMSANDLLKAENDKLKADQANLSERLEAERQTRLRTEDQVMISALLSEGRITPKQGEIANLMLLHSRGDEVKLSDADEEPADFKDLLSAFLSENERQVPITEEEEEGAPATVVPAKGKPGDRANLSESNKIADAAVARAKEIAKAEGGDFKTHYGRAFREVAAAKPEGAN